MGDLFSEKYPLIALWISNQGYIELGEDDHYTSWIRVYNEGGMIVEIEDGKSLDEALNLLESYFENEFEDEWGYSIDKNND